VRDLLREPLRAAPSREAAGNERRHGVVPYPRPSSTPAAMAMTFLRERRAPRRSRRYWCRPGTRVLRTCWPASRSRSADARRPRGIRSATSLAKLVRKGSEPSWYRSEGSRTRRRELQRIDLDALGSVDDDRVLRKKGSELRRYGPDRMGRHDRKDEGLSRTAAARDESPRWMRKRVSGQVDAVLPRAGGLVGKLLLVHPQVTACPLCASTSARAVPTRRSMTRSIPA